jgi:hypothetical protein
MIVRSNKRFFFSLLLRAPRLQCKLYDKYMYKMDKLDAYALFVNIIKRVFVRRDAKLKSHYFK